MASAITDDLPDYLLKLVLVGDSAVGKTSLLLRYSEDTFSDSFIATIGVDFKIKTRHTPDGFKVKMQLWDTAGQDRFKTIVSSFYRGADGLILVFDVTDPLSFQHITTWLQEAEQYGRSNIHLRCVRLLVGNKIDLTKDRKISTQQGEELAKRLGMKYVETSAKTAHRVHEALDELSDEIVQKFRADGTFVLSPDYGGADGGKVRLATTELDNQGYCGGYCGGLW